VGSLARAACRTPGRARGHRALKRVLRVAAASVGSLD
jgi:hypothetical protein